MLACKSFTQSAAKILANTRSNSEAVRYVKAFASSSTDYPNQNPLAHSLEGPPLNQRIKLENNEITFEEAPFKDSDSSKDAEQTVDSKELRKDFNKFYELATPQITSLFTDNVTSKRVKDTLNNFHRHVMEVESNEIKKTDEGKHRKSLKDNESIESHRGR